MGLTILIAVIAVAVEAGAGDVDEFKVKRQEVYEFTEKPAVARDGDPSTGSGRDKVTIRFASKAFCDATVAIENANGRIVRHLASGVLGPNAPEPFQKNSLAQAVVWDTKDDRGRYLENLAGHTVRVSLGLKPRFERALFWGPKRRFSYRVLLMQPCEQGMLVYDGNVVDHLRLFGRKGDYVRTVYPFPAGQLDKVRGLRTQTFPQDGRDWPLKEGFFQATLLTCGPNAGPQHADGMPGRAGSALAVSPGQPGRIALLDRKLNRLSIDGDSAGLPLTGPATSITVPRKGEHPQIDVPPLSAAFSPDGKYLYLTAYFWKTPVSYLAEFQCLPAVLRMEFAGDKEPELFVGSLKVAEAGKGDAQLNVPCSVACDSSGRVYVADFFNDRVQVFSPDGKLLKSIPTRKPAQVCIHQKTQQVYVFSWAMPNRQTSELSVKPPMLTRFGPFDEPRKLDEFELPVSNYLDVVTTWYGGSHIGKGWGQPLHAAVDSWSDPVAIWLVREGVYLRDPRDDAGCRLLTIRDGKLVETRNFAADTLAAIKRLEPPVFSRQRLYVNPKDGALYVAEGRGYCKSFVQLVAVTPGSGEVDLVDIPLSAEDMAFDQDGLLYLRTNKEMARYDPVTWREVPFDYGEERDKMGYTASGMGLKTAAVNSALAMPAPATWHQGGMCISPLGQIAVSCYNKTLPPNRAEVPQVHRTESYVPQLFPGRARFGEVHVWDPHGKMAREDAVGGLGILNGVGLDREGSLYVLAARNRVLDGKPYFNSMAGTLMKFPAAARGKIVSTSGAPVPLTKEAEPGRPADIVNNPHGRGWVDGAAWKYGGVGFGGKNLGTGCACWNCRFALDYFARSFAPEIDHYSVAVLDTAGNLIVRIGRYGNVDDGEPLISPQITQKVRESLKYSESAGTPIGGDEVALFHACFLATETDRRLFIADAGNARILSVKLDYHATERIPLAAGD